MKFFREELIMPAQKLTVRIGMSGMTYAGGLVGSHWHEYYEVLYVVQGQVKARVEDREYKLSHKDLLMVQPGEIHHTEAMSKEGCLMIVLQFYPSCLNIHHNSDSYSRYLNKYISDFDLFNPLLRSPHLYEEELELVMTQINEEALKEDGGSEFMIRGYIYLFLGILQRTGNFSICYESRRTEKFSIVDCCKYLEEHFQEEISLEKVAGKYGYSKQYFSKIFKESLGINYKAFVDYIRITEAERLMNFDNLSIASVAEKVGYVNQSSFSRAYRRLRGCAPSQEEKVLSKI